MADGVDPNSPAISLSVFPGGDLSDPAWVEAIIANPDPVVRNLQITQSYHQFTVDFARRVDPRNVCWCAFATWASKQAGQFIRGEQVPETIREFLGIDQDDNAVARPWYWFLIPKWILRSRMLRSYARLTVEDISAQIAEGNLLVYTKLAHIFAGFLLLMRDSSQADNSRLQSFIDELRLDPTTGEGLRQAFSLYYAARFEAGAKTRAEMIFLANLLVGQHEQIRLQQAIEGALTAPIRRALDDPERRWSKLPLPPAVRQLGAAAFKAAFGPAIRRFEDQWKGIATQAFMTLATPGGPLKLGQDLPPLPNGEVYPADLLKITLPELQALLDLVDYSPNTITGSAARDWARLEDRLNYIADLFRSRQQDETLFRPPFKPDQLSAIRSGRRPEGAL